MPFLMVPCCFLELLKIAQDCSFLAIGTGRFQEGFVGSKERPKGVIMD
jgi:hypothetical protein